MSSVSAVWFAAMWKAAGAALAAVAVCGCGGGTDRPDSDAGALLACRSFFQVAEDYDTFTGDEFRDRLRGIDNDAKVSEEPGVATSARAMIVAATGGTEPELVAAINAMNDACHQLD